jgi:uracil-DNA glycosylase family 4
MTRDEALHFWDGLEKWSKYGFNKSHSVEYAMLGYWCSWLKRYFPTEFICGSLTYGAKDKKSELVEEAYRLGLTLVLPKVGQSHHKKWTVKENQLWIPFIEVKGIGPSKAIKASKARASDSKNIRKFYSKKSKTIERFTGAFGELLDKIGAYELSTTFNVGDEVKDLFDFRVTANPREEYKNLYSMFRNNLRLSYLDPVLQGEYKVIRKLTKNLNIIRRADKTFVRHRELAQCELCDLVNECKAPVQPSPGRLNIMVVGEAPGPDEDKERIGFIGRSGNKIWTYLADKGYNRKLFHVTNVAKCYPSKSRKPNKEQMQICGKHYLEKEIEWIRPRVILAFGNTCLEYFMGQKAGITNMSGKVQWIEKYEAWFVWCLHPAATLHNPDNKTYYEAGMKSFCKLLRALRVKKK